jgi:hypothetical protein
MQKDPVSAEVAVEGKAIVNLANNPQALARLSHAAALGCTDRELADWLEVDEDALAQFETRVLQARAQLRLRMRTALLTQADRGVPEALNYIIGELKGKK